jgi:hypothetical protein
LLGIGAGGWLEAGFPNPYWVQGSAHVQFTVLGKDLGYTADVSYGTRCDPNVAPEIFIDSAIVMKYEQEDAAAMNSNLILGVRPNSSNSILTTPAYLKPSEGVFASFGFTPDEEFSFEEQQSNGETKYRKFKVIYEVKIDSLGKAGNFPANQASINQNLGIIQNNQNPSTNNPTTTTTNLLTMKRSTTINNMGEYQYRVNRGSGMLADLFNFADSSKYKVTITAKLMESVNLSHDRNPNVWVVAKRKNGTEVKQTKTTLFNTGSTNTNAQSTNNTYTSPQINGVTTINNQTGNINQPGNGNIPRINNQRRRR